MSIAAQCLHGARVCVIPRPENNYRPLALQRRSLTFVSALLVLTKVFVLGVVALTPAPAELATITSARIVDMTNAERQEAGLAPLAVNEKLTAAAQAKAADMLENDYFAHISPAGVTPWFWIQREQYQYQLAGENLAIDFIEAEDVVAAWMASPSHRENILQPDYAETGVAVLSGEFQGHTSTIVVHMFGLAAGETSPQVAGEGVEEDGTAGESPPAATTPPAESTPIPPTPAPTAPAVPRIAVAGGSATVGTSLILDVSGDASSIVTLLVNNQERKEVTLPGIGTSRTTIDISDIADGEGTLRASARSAEGLSSDLSEPIVFIKDTTGPAIARHNLQFLVSPATDMPSFVLRVSDAARDGLTIGGGGIETRSYSALTASWLEVPYSESPLTFTAFDEAGNARVVDNVGLVPSFYTERDLAYLEPPARFSRIMRQAALAVALVVLLLLLLALLVRIRVQHPRMIAHASFVILLGLAFFWL